MPYKKNIDIIFIMKKQVIAYTHFHWDREWYKEFEKFRFRLLKSFDIVLDMLSTDKLPSFYFDGHTSALLDYLEICPQKKELIKSLIKDKRLFIGPFYCLVDEFLTSKEAFTKNIEIGINIASEFGCMDFIAYFADTFGHSAYTIPILNNFGIDKAMVWRGCPDIPANFVWEYNSNKVKTINLVRGYFHDIFASELPINKKVDYLKTNLDKIAEKSGQNLILPVGADHLAVPQDLNRQIQLVNSELDDYEIILGSPFDYFNKAENEFKNYTHKGELRDNSKTFILEGCYSSRLDIKNLNIIASHRLKMAEKICKPEYKNLIDYAYKLLLQNQAHDSICGCSTDDTHKENIIRYKKILQIIESIFEDYKLNNKKEELQVLNLGEDDYTGTLLFESEKEYPYPILNTKRGFPADIFNDIYKIPITEDYTDIHTYIINCKSQNKGLNPLNQELENDVFISENAIGNSKVFLQIKNNKVYLGEHEIKLIDYIDLGDSYNFGPKEDDSGYSYNLSGSKVILNDPSCSILELNFEDIKIHASLSANDNKIKFDIDWINSRKNHLLQLCVDTNKDIVETYSEDLNEIITRNFNPNYDVRKHLPKTKGIEVMLNNAPMQRGVCANNLCIVTKGITQYEVLGSEIRLPLLRATGLISNPQNTARTTPAGPPIEVEDLQQLGKNHQSLWICLENNLKKVISNVYNECILVI